MTGSHLFCFGLGYSALALARRLAASGWDGDRHLPQRREGLVAARGGLLRRSLRSRAADRCGGVERASPISSSRFLPMPLGDPVLALHGDDIAAMPGLFLARLSVDDRGLWRSRRRLGRRDRSAATDRRARPPPGRCRSRAGSISGATAACRSTSSGSPPSTARGRSAFDALRAGTAKRIDKPGQVFSRIHVEDLASVLIASMERPRPGAVYNVCDDDPAPPEAVVAYAAELLGHAAAAAGAARCRRALADGTQLLRRQQAGREPPDQDRTRSRPCVTRIIAPGWPRSWPRRLAQKRRLRHRPARR